jgi:hypothetical protein
MDSRLPAGYGTSSTFIDSIKGAKATQCPTADRCTNMQLGVTLVTHLAIFVIEVSKGPMSS